MISRKKIKPGTASVVAVVLETRVSKPLQLGFQLDDLRENRKKAAFVDAFLNHGQGKRPTKGKVGRAKATPIELAVAEAKRRSREGDWSGAKGKVFVGLYALCHEIVYGDVPLELTENQELTIGARMVNRVLHDFFDDDPDALVEFIKWSWEAEKRKESWALRNGISRQRMRVRLQFSARLVQDYRTEKQRSGRRR
jgi:hypothetical protein